MIGSLAEADAARPDLVAIVRAWCAWRSAGSPQPAKRTKRATKPAKRAVKPAKRAATPAKRAAKPGKQAATKR